MGRNHQSKINSKDQQSIYLCSFRESFGSVCEIMFIKFYSLCIFNSFFIWAMVKGQADVATTVCYNSSLEGKSCKISLNDNIFIDLNNKYVQVS